MRTARNFETSVQAGKKKVQDVDFLYKKIGFGLCKEWLLLYTIHLCEANLEHGFFFCAESSNEEVEGALHTLERAGGVCCKLLFSTSQQIPHGMPLISQGYCICQWSGNQQ